MTISKPIKKNYIKIIFDSQLSFKLLFSFLKYSTHVNYLAEFSDSSFPYWTDIRQNQTKNIIGSIIFSKKLLLLEKNGDIKKSALNNQVIYTLNKKMTHFNDLVIKILNDYNLKDLEADFLIDFEGELNLLSIIVSEDENTSILLASDLKKYSIFFDFNKTQKLSKVTNVFVKCRFVIDDYSSKKLQYSFSQINSDNFDLYGSAGANLPLIAVMSLLKIKIHTQRTIALKNIRKIAGEYKYKFNFKNVYIDLDQTLIWHWYNKSIDPMYNFIIKCYKNKAKVILLTRHKKNINKTLIKCQIDPNIFYDIIKVEDNQLKSIFIKEKCSIFIDDEYNQRLDVLFNTSINVLAPYQIKYLYK